MSKIKNYLNEAKVTEEQLKTRIKKIGEAAQKIQLQKYKLETRLENVGKIMQRQKMDKIDFGNGYIITQRELLNDAGTIVFNMMA